MDTQCKSRVDDYLNGLMSPDESEIFLDDLQNDFELKVLFDLMRIQRQNEKKRLFANVERLSLELEQKRKPKPLNQIWYVMGTAAAIGLLIFMLPRESPVLGHFFEIMKKAPNRDSIPIAVEINGKRPPDNKNGSNSEKGRQSSASSDLNNYLNVASSPVPDSTTTDIDSKVLSTEIAKYAEVLNKIPCYTIEDARHLGVSQLPGAASDLKSIFKVARSRVDNMEYDSALLDIRKIEELLIPGDTSQYLQMLDLKAHTLFEAHRFDLAIEPLTKRKAMLDALQETKYVKMDCYEMLLVCYVLTQRENSPEAKSLNKALQEWKSTIPDLIRKAENHK